MGLVAHLILLVAISIGETACTSIYDRARTQLPPEPTAELRLRVAEAAKARNVAEQAGVRLLDSLQRRKAAGVTETDFDRLAAAAFDFERRVWAANDAAERCRKPAEFAGEIEDLDRQARSWLEYVQTSRAGDPSAQLRQLQALLPGQQRPR